MTREETFSKATPVAVVGLGFLGRGIATCLLGRGFRVIGCDHSAKSRELAHSYITLGLRELVEQADMDATLVNEWSDRYQETDSLDDCADCGFVIESIVEDVAAKIAVFDNIESVVGPTVPIGSNTSAIPISQLQKNCKNPERLLGMHWFEPAHATRFLELIPGERTSDATMKAAINLAHRCGKDPGVLARDIPGFVVNRLAYAMYREALYLIELGIADAETIDRSFRNACGVWSTICGPLQWIDLTGGPAVYAECMKRVLPTLCNSVELPLVMRRLVEEGALGVVNGHGFYEYTPEQAERADALFHQHVWTARALMNRYFPMEEE